MVSKHTVWQLRNLLIALLLTATKLNSQSLQLGPVLSFGIASNRDDSPFSRRFGVSESAGMQAAFHLGEQIGLQTGFQFQLKGFRQEEMIIDPLGLPLGTTTVQRRTGFLMMPLVMNLKFGTKLQWFFDVGGAYNHLFYEEIDQKPSFGSFAQPIETIPSKLPFELCGIFGIGCEVPIGKDASIVASFRNSIGFTDRSHERSAFHRAENTHCLQLAFCFGNK